MKITTLFTIACMSSLGLVHADKITDLEKRIAELEKASGSSSDSAFDNLDNSFSGGGLSWADKTSIGGYGELHYNMSLSDNGDQVDFHRWVLFVNHEFSDSVKLFSEFELEHSLAGDGKPGEVELEQAYLEFDAAWLNEGLKFKTGLFLTPVGILNETHEPNTFYGVERNNVEKRIIPTTWWEGGIGVSQTTDNGFQFDLNLTSALAVPDGVIRSGRKKAAEHDNPELAITGRVRYTGIEGLELATTAQYSASLDADHNAATLVSSHAVYQKGGFQLKALWSSWFYDFGPGIDTQDGFYVEPGYRFETPGGDVGVFARYAQLSYWTGSAEREQTEYTVGVNYWPHENVVLKADLNWASSEDDGVDRADDNTLNLGVGYSF